MLLIQYVLYHFLQDSKTFPLARVHQYRNHPIRERRKKEQSRAVRKSDQQTRVIGPDVCACSFFATRFCGAIITCAAYIIPGSNLLLAVTIVCFALVALQYRS